MESDTVIEEVYENQRWHLAVGWSDTLFLTERPHLSTRTGDRAVLMERPPAGWQWVDAWRVDRAPGDENPDGWCYGMNFENVGTARRTRARTLDVTRWRRWIRRRQRVATSAIPDELRAAMSPILGDGGAGRVGGGGGPVAPSAPVAPTAPAFASGGARSGKEALPGASPSLLTRESSTVPPMTEEEVWTTLWAGYNPAADMPEYMCCPITLDVFKEPRLAPSGHTYERREIERVIATQGRDPFTRIELRDAGALVRNRKLEDAARAWNDFFKTGVATGLGDGFPDAAHPDDLRRQASSRAAERADAEVGGGFWTCPICTFVNTGRDTKCSMCESDVPEGARLLSFEEAGIRPTGTTVAATGGGAGGGGGGGRGGGGSSSPASSSSSSPSLGDAGRALLRSASGSGLRGGVPVWLCCDLTQEGPMTDPVTTKEGFTYERAALLEYWRLTCGLGAAPSASLPASARGRSSLLSALSSASSSSSTSSTVVLRDPRTEAALGSDPAAAVITNLAIRNACEEFRSRKQRYVDAEKARRRAAREAATAATATAPALVAPSGGFGGAGGGAGGFADSLLPSLAVAPPPPSYASVTGPLGGVPLASYGLGAVPPPSVPAMPTPPSASWRVDPALVLPPAYAPSSTAPGAAVRRTEV